VTKRKRYGSRTRNVFIDDEAGTSDDNNDDNEEEELEEEEYFRSGRFGGTHLI
jgi:hypothetical protein